MLESGDTAEELLGQIDSLARFSSRNSVAPLTRLGIPYRARARGHFRMEARYGDRRLCVEAAYLPGLERGSQASRDTPRAQGWLNLFVIDN